MKTLLFALALALLPTLAHAQTLVSQTLQVYAPGVDPTTGSPTQSTVIPQTSFTCNQTAPVVPAQVVNPTTVFMDDPANPGKVCIAASAAGAFLLALPNTPGNWQATMVATDSLNQSSPRSAASNTFQLDKVGAPTGVHLK